jgi:hypothetical protein
MRKLAVIAVAILIASKAFAQTEYLSLDGYAGAAQPRGH